MTPLNVLIVLAACVAAVYIRLQAVFNYGRVIHEFDPWFNFRATQYLVDHGYKAFSTWFDDRSWCVPCARGHLRCASPPARCQTEVLRVHVYSYCMQQARARGERVTMVRRNCAALVVLWTGGICRTETMCASLIHGALGHRPC